MVDPEPGDVLAPDGIIIRPVAGVSSQLVSVVIGIISPCSDDYPVHFHDALEQVTYCVSGEVTAVTRGLGDTADTTATLGPGQAVTTPPLTTLSFRNRGAEDAVVLFICVPPYPATNAGTHVVGSTHRELRADELTAAVARLRTGAGHLAAVLGARADTTEWLLPAATEADRTAAVVSQTAGPEAKRVG